MGGCLAYNKTSLKRLQLMRSNYLLIRNENSELLANNNVIEWSPSSGLSQPKFLGTESLDTIYYKYYVPFISKIYPISKRYSEFEILYE